MSKCNQCCHCGTVQTPCWRRGPPEKPVLCNACGARYLTKLSLEGYWPGGKSKASSPTAAATSSNGHLLKAAPRARFVSSTGPNCKALHAQTKRRSLDEPVRPNAALGLAQFPFSMPQLPLFAPSFTGLGLPPLDGLLAPASMLPFCPASLHRTPSLHSSDRSDSGDASMQDQGRNEESSSSEDTDTRKGNYMPQFTAAEFAATVSGLLHSAHAALAPMDVMNANMNSAMGPSLIMHMGTVASQRCRPIPVALPQRRPRKQQHPSTCY